MTKTLRTLLSIVAWLTVRLLPIGLLIFLWDSTSDLEQLIGGFRAALGKDASYANRAHHAQQLAMALFSVLAFAVHGLVERVKAHVQGCHLARLGIEVQADPSGATIQQSATRAAEIYLQVRLTTPRSTLGARLLSWVLGESSIFIRWDGSVQRSFRLAGGKGIYTCFTEPDGPTYLRIPLQGGPYRPDDVSLQEFVAQVSPEGAEPIPGTWNTFFRIEICKGFDPGPGDDGSLVVSESTALERWLLSCFLVLRTRCNGSDRFRVRVRR